MHRAAAGPRNHFSEDGFWVAEYWGKRSQTFQPILILIGLAGVIMRSGHTVHVIPHKGREAVQEILWPLRFPIAAMRWQLLSAAMTDRQPEPERLLTNCTYRPLHRFRNRFYRQLGF